MTDFRVTANGVAMSFEITGGLIAGYEPAVGREIHTIVDVFDAHAKWQEQTKTVQGVRVHPTHILWGISHHEPTTGESTVYRQGEPGFVISGEINPFYDHDLTWAEAYNRIKSLAEFVAERLGQGHIYLKFDDRLYILDNIEVPA